jgi:enoyl-CoA hydratase/3-hydroxyacyl-CoA dehydrogenase
MSHPLDATHDTLAVTAPAEGVVHVQLDRQPELNAISEALLDELERAVEALAGDDAAHALVVSGAGGRAFSVGADRRRLDDLDPGAAYRLSRRGQRAFDAVARFPGPVLAAIDGYCLGGGMELALCADLRIAGPDATFGQPEADHGLVPGWGGTQRLPRVVGGDRAKEIIFSGAEYDAETMARYGLLTEVADDPVAAAIERAETFTEYPPAVHRHAKRAMSAGGDADAAGFEQESLAFALLVARRADEQGG